MKKVAACALHGRETQSSIAKEEQEKATARSEHGDNQYSDLDNEHLRTTQIVDWMLLDFRHGDSLQCVSVPLSILDHATIVENCTCVVGDAILHRRNSLLYGAG